jgi:hypothetical protein
MYDYGTYLQPVLLFFSPNANGSSSEEGLNMVFNEICLVFVFIFLIYCIRYIIIVHPINFYCISVLTAHISDNTNSESDGSLSDNNSDSDSISDQEHT